MNINGAPQVTLLEPATEVTVRLGDALELRASAQDPNGISRIEFYDGADKIAEGSASPYVLSVNAPGGRHVITAHAVDSLGAIGASPHVAVNKDTDSDNDGLGDEWEMFFFGNLDQQGDGDSDSDGATNLQEYRAASLPNNHDTDADGVSDGDEINVYHTNATAKDTDGDGMDDGWEVQHHLNPTANDADDDDDHDGLTNKQEFAYGTDPMKPDTDGDHVPDGIDGWPLNEAVAPPRLPIFRYAILDITQTRIWAVNNSPDGVAIHPLDREGVYFPSAYLETADDHLISPNASNDLGRTVGSIAYTHLANGGTTFGPPHACILPATHDGSATPLFLWGDSNQSFAPGSVAVDINNAGQVLIQSISSPSGDWIHHGAIWQDGEVTDVAVGDPVRINQQGTVLMADFITKRGQPLVLPFPPNDLTDSYADDTEAVIGSGSHGGEIWRNGKSAALPVPEGTGDPYRINNRVQIFGDIFTRPGFAGNAGIWQNGQFFYIRNLIPQDSGGEWDRVSSSGVVKELRINDRAMIIVRANHVLQDGSGRTAYNTPFLLMPVELMVDANRDGQMSFTDAMIHDADQTEEARPYRFWLNDDDDTELNFNGEGGASTGPAEGDKVPVPRPDHSLHQIVSKRNLEDFSRLWIYLGGLQESIKSGDIQIGLRWRNVASGNAPAINIYPSADEEGSSSYLTDETAAQAQISGVYNDAVRDFGNLQTIGPHDLFLFKKDYWNELSADQPRKCLLFEGAGEGKGELEIVFFNRNFDEIGRGGSLWLDLKNVKRMYERAKASPDPLTPLPFSLNSGSFDEGGLSYTPDVNPGFEQPEGEQEQCLIFVHGWRMSYSDSVTFSEIMFKRLWWQGFAGRFVAFRWGTQTSFDSYNTSEWLAWKYGKSLRDYVEHYLKAEMPTYSMNVAAHSMGNIVTGSALRRGMRINAYMLMEAAVPSGCFNDSVNNYNKFLDAEMTSPTPDSADEKGYRLFLESVGQNVTKLISFFNIDDYALATGTIPLPGGLIGVPLGFPYATNWEKNQVDFKPNRFNAANSLFGDYLFTSSNPVGRRVSVNWGQTLGGSYSVSREVTDIHESMAFAARPRSKAAGAELHNASVFGSVLNLESSCNFGADFKDHGGQFLRGIQELGPFYSRMNEELKQ